MPNLCLPPTKDTDLDDVNPNVNYGSSAAFNWRVAYVSGSKTVYDRTVITFQVPPEVKVAEVYKAILCIYDYGPLGAATAVSVYRCTDAWTEAGATWNKRDGVNDWTAGPGGTFADWTVPIDFTSRTTAGWYNIDVTTQVIQAINSYGGLFDLLIRLDTENPGSGWWGDQCNSKEIAALREWSRPFLLIVRPPFGKPREV